jgi:hypothetical protein
VRFLAALTAAIVAVASPAAWADPLAVYKGPIAKPDFTNSPREARLFRTAIREGLRGGVNFAGHYTIIMIGCGAGCRLVFLADARSGRITSFPLSGEQYYLLQLDFHPDSPVVKARWQRQLADHADCVAETLVLHGDRFRRISEARTAGDCPA